MTRFKPWPHNTILDNDTILPPMDLSEASLEQAIADIREIQLGSAIRGVCLSFQPTRAFISPRFLRPTQSYLGWTSMQQWREDEP